MEQNLELSQAQTLGSVTRRWNLPPGLRWKSFRRFNLNFYLGAILIAVVLFGGIFASSIAQYAPDTIFRGAQLSAPGNRFWLGTDPLGRDLFSRLLHGVRYSLGMSLAATLISAVPGVFLGILSGYRGGWLDLTLSRFIDVWLSLPGLLLALLLIARLGPSITTTAIALGISGIPTMFRVLRAETRSLGKMPFVEAAESMGAAKWWVIMKHLLPNLSSTIIVLGSIRVGTFLLAGSGLSFIGLGAQPPQPEWGALLASGKDYLSQAWWLIVFPSLAIMLTVLGFNLFGDGLRDYYARKSD